MELGTPIGIGLVFGAVGLSMIMEGSSPASLLLPPPMILVFVGTFGAAMAGGMLKDATGVVGYLKRAMTAKPAANDDVVMAIVAMADRARREGLLALEEAARDIEDPFLKRGIELTVDGTDPEELATILEAQIDAKRRADKAGVKFFADMGGYAPTIGIIGTVIGLVHVLGNLSTPESLGHLIAGAFVATLWGVMSANAMWLPISNKLKRVSEAEVASMELVLEGVLAVQSGTNPRMVEQRLRSLLPPAPPAPADEPAAEAA
jgi:chemotaxis protein MotA